MKQYWLRLAERFDAMSLRERVLVAAGVILVTAYMSYFLLVDPMVTTKSRLQQAIEQERAMVKSVDAIIAAEQRRDDRTVRHAYQAALRKQVAEVNESLKGMQKRLVPPEQMAKLLEGMIVHVRGVDLMSLRKLPVQSVQPAQRGTAGRQVGTAATGEKKNGAATAVHGVYQHGFELTIQGSYAGLHDYLVRLETLPWRIFWGKLSLDAERHPDIRLTLIVQTLSLDRTWLTI